MNALLGGILVWASWTRHVVLDFVLPNSFHESCLRPGLDRRTVKREVLWCTEVANELCQGITNMVSINLLDWV